MSDEMETRVIEVTQEDIEQGLGRNCECCPVAMAFKRQLAEEVAVRVATKTICFPMVGKSFPLPDKVSDWIYRFDCSRSEGPFTFEMELPKEFWRAA